MLNAESDLRLSAVCSFKLCASHSIKSECDPVGPDWFASVDQTELVLKPQRNQPFLCPAA